MKNSQFKHLIELNLATIFLSTSGVLGKLITLSATYTILMRCVVAVILIFLFERVRGNKPVINIKKDWLFFVKSGVLLGLHWATYFYAIQISSVAVAVLSLFTFPIITTLLEPLFFKTKLSLFNAIGAAMVLVGIFFIIPDFDLSNKTTLGAFSGVFSALCFSVRNLLNKKYVGVYSSSTIMLYQLLVSIILLSPTLYFSDVHISISNAGYLFLLGFITTAVGQTMFVQSLKNFSAATASVITSIQPVYGILMAFLIIEERPAPQVIIGGSMILFTVFAENIRQISLNKKMESS
ncbi:EamA family transporter [Flammeovirgaceae bacterium SG7u.111]|nr:EamA family transporter [Flammeovirgaceae bacterium SG7u.132]WPO33085.1 EamA family transporter [Flammeovirgaceae bacterium SG7u.111]